MSFLWVLQQPHSLEQIVFPEEGRRLSSQLEKTNPLSARGPDSIEEQLRDILGRHCLRGGRRRKAEFFLRKREDGKDW